METVVVIERSDRRRFEDGELENSAYSTSPHKQIADPIVYKLVRVEGDGRLVPATDDEIIEVVDLLKDDKSDMDIVDDYEENVTSSTCESSGRKNLLDISGYCESVKAEEEKIDLKLQEAAPCSANNSDPEDNNLSVAAGESSNPTDSSKDGAPPIAVCASLKPDFSKLMGEICLDNLSIRELHDTFRATFGRETTVKDKAWLKRRISMGLTNSCDVSTTSFFMKDGKVLKPSKEGTSTCIPDPITSPRNRVRDEHSKGSAIHSSSQTEDCQVLHLKRLRNYDLVDGSEADVLHQEEGAVKRIRKPTRRYIEELSELETVEHNERLMNSSRSSEQLSPKSGARPASNVSSGGKMIRLDSLSGIRVPCVSRIRRSRPRKDIMSLAKFYHTGMGVAENFGKPFGTRSYQSAAESGADHAKPSFTPKQVQLLEDPDLDEQFLVMDEIELQHKDITLKDPGSSEDVPNDNITTVVPTAKGGVRRKHHRAWTLSEVIKLVEGVSKFGAGRWSEIKRLSFASYSYRTSVDLKDKWRNLLKAASFASSPTDLMNSRKHAVTPIPAPILTRIRELAERNGQAPSPNLNSSNKVAAAAAAVSSRRTTPSGPEPTGYL